MTRPLTILTSLLVLCSLTPISAQWQSTQIHTGSVSFQSVTNALGLTGNTSLFLNGAGALASPGGGGGETTWTNSSGLITTTPTNANVLSFTSQSPDNATNVAVVVDTAGDWLAGDEEKLQVWRHHGTNTAYMTPWGSIEIGRSIAPYWNPDKSDLIAGLHDQSQGESDRSYVFLGAVDNGGSTTNYGTLTFQGESSSGYSTLEIDSRHSGSIHDDWTMNAEATANSFFTYRVSGGSFIDVKPLFFQPNIDSGTAYKLGTSVAFTSGNLFSLPNATTNRFSVAFDGATTITQSATEPAAPAAGNFTLFAVDSGGGKMILKVKFPTGSAQTVATEP